MPILWSVSYIFITLHYVWRVSVSLFYAQADEACIENIQTMFNAIVRFSVRKKLFVALTSVFLLIGGIYAMLTLPIDAVPDITNNQVQIVTVSPTLAPQEVEQLITIPVETSMSNIMNVTEIRSVSRFGLSLVTAGALGNIIDCMFYGVIFDYAGLMQGRVVDMLYFPLFTFPDWVPLVGGDIFFSPVFNIADSAITIGMLYLILFQWKFIKNFETIIGQKQQQ